MLSTAIAFSAMAADLPKEGSYKGNYYAVGSIKTITTGKDRLIVAFDETGLQTTDGFQDHMTSHCLGTDDYTNGIGQITTNCISTDMSGDKLIVKGVSEKHTPDQKEFVLDIRCDGGTGKYAGATCSEKDTAHVNQFPSPSDDSYVVWVNFEGKYKLQ